MKQRLNKLIARSGLCSRRKAEELIKNKKVTVNGKIVAEPGACADPSKDTILVNGSPLAKKEEHVYILLNKPLGYTSTVKDIHAEKTILDLLPKMAERVYPIGRLDKDTSGLIILTNDGELHYELSHPKFEINRVYEVTVINPVHQAAIKKLEQGGMAIEDYKTSPCKIQTISRAQDKTILRITIREGKKRQIRKMFSICGHPVIELKRLQFGKLKLGDLKSGEYRFLKKEEIL